MDTQGNSPIPNQGPTRSKGPWEDYASFGLEFGKIVILALLIVAPIRYFVFQPFIVKGESMTPNFHPGDYLIIDELSYRFSQPQRGDVVVFNYPQDETQRFIKRVIGLPGETVMVSGGKVQITKDGETRELKESYLPQDLRTYGNSTITLSEGEYFVMGDNREHSYDSRMWGFVPKEDIIGKSLIRLFPINALSGFSRPTYEF